jgi:hypothetical protein
MSQTITEYTARPEHKNNDLDPDALGDIKTESVAHIDHQGETKSHDEDNAVHHARSKWEDLPYKTTLRLFWKGALVCFLAAFSSFTDGYQVRLPLGKAPMDHFH